MTAREHWKLDPEEHDYSAAASYLSLLLDEKAVDVLLAELRAASIGHWKAKDLLRASHLALLPTDNVHVVSDLKKVKDGAKLSPVLLIRGNMSTSTPLQIVDGYHRVCASYYIDEDADIPSRMVDAPKA
ncbi:MAG: hypothetical protein ABSA14_11795 [Acidimicrobiales bacterium]